MRQNGAFIGLCTGWATQRTFLGRRVSSGHLEGPPVSVDQVNVDC